MTSYKSGYAECDEIREVVLREFGYSSSDITLLAGQGSDRLFYRIGHSSGSMILMVYGSQKAENDYYVHIQQFLRSIDVNVPAVILHMPEKRWVFLEDLGTRSLYSVYSDLSTDMITAMYRMVIDQTAKIFYDGYDIYKTNPFVTAPAFDYKLYHWEHRYFIDNYLRGFRKITYPLTGLEKNLTDVARFLAGQRNRLIHRDLQSQNIIIKQNRPYLIDFQGLRRGLPAYDLASLLCDPYICMNQHIKSELLDYYINKYYLLLDSGNADTFRDLFAVCSVQRIMQALGAYCFLGLKKNKQSFLSYIQPAETILNEAIHVSDMFPELGKILDSLS